jgi:hypothetical protein
VLDNRRIKEEKHERPDTGYLRDRLCRKTCRSIVGSKREECKSSSAQNPEVVVMDYDELDSMEDSLQGVSQNCLIHNTGKPPWLIEVLMELYGAFGSGATIQITGTAQEMSV